MFLWIESMLVATTVNWLFVNGYLLFVDSGSSGLSSPD
jgi:hypothetical protein